MSIQHPTFTRVLRLRLKDKHARALRERAYWVNQVWNYCNDLSIKQGSYARRKPPKCRSVKPSLL